jgi:hypothetical protein
MPLITVKSSCSLSLETIVITPLAQLSILVKEKKAVAGLVVLPAMLP